MADEGLSPSTLDGLSLVAMAGRPGPAPSGQRQEDECCNDDKDDDGQT
jgi:hypothetical protein